MADKPATQATRPLTPAQIEVLEQMMEDRAARLHAQVTSLIADAVTPLEQTIAQLQQTVAQLQSAVASSLQYGQPVALRAHAGKLMCAAEGGPTTDDETFVFKSRPSAGPWESFVPERGSW